MSENKIEDLQGRDPLVLEFISSSLGNFLFTDFRAPLPPPTPLFKIAWNSIALNTSSYDVVP